jgi:antitoxin VapB
MKTEPFSNLTEAFESRTQQSVAGFSNSYTGYILQLYGIESGEVFMSQGSVFINNRTQSVRLPADMRFPEGIKKVVVRAVGADRVLSPIDHTWDSFFASAETVTDDFMVDRAEQAQPEREAL